MPALLRMTAFPATPEGGNPAGVVLDAAGLSDADMLRIAAEIGYAETAFLTAPLEPGAGSEHEPGPGLERDPGTDGVIDVRIRYFSPVAEVPFCGHATVATAAVLAEQHGPGSYRFHTDAGDVRLEATATAEGILVSFTSVEPQTRPVDADVLAKLLAELGLSPDDLDPRFPPLESFAGNWHPVITLTDVEVFNQFRFSPAPIAAMLAANGWTGTITILHARSDHEFDARNLFPVGRITEDPATGSAAASTGAYLRAIGHPASDIVIHQGAHVGRPSVLRVRIPATGGIVVTGTAMRITEPTAEKNVPNDQSSS